MLPVVAGQLSRLETGDAMRVSDTGQAVLRYGSAPAAAAAPAELRADSRALIAIAPVAEAHQPSALYRQAPFLAQLIATKDQHPQTRERRRAAPEEAVAAYRATAKLAKPAA